MAISMKENTNRVLLSKYLALVEYLFRHLESDCSNILGCSVCLLRDFENLAFQ